jgi:hypothetical protein
MNIEVGDWVPFTTAIGIYRGIVIAIHNDIITVQELSGKQYNITPEQIRKENETDADGYTVNPCNDANFYLDFH